jgi:tetratricopeptide (TPR) repeat protein
MQADHATQADMLRRLNQTETYLNVDPGNTDLLAMAIDLRLALADVGRAATHASAACALYPEDPFFVYRRAHVLAAQSDWGTAEPLFAALLAAHPNLNVAYSLADCRVRLGRHQDAWDAIAAYRADPALSPEAATLMVRVLHHLAQFDLGQEIIAEQRERLAAEPVFLAAASLLLLDLGEVDQAQALSDAALSAGTRPLEALVVSGTLALGATNTDTAIARFNEVLSINPREGRSWSGLGLASLLRRDLDGATVQLEQAVKFMPKHIGSWHALGWCRLFREDLAGAQADFETALGLDRNFGESHGAVAVAAAIKGERAVAEAAIERALRLDPKGLTARYAQMVLSGQASDPERFRAIAYRLLSGRTTTTGEDMAAVVKRYSGDTE